MIGADKRLSKAAWHQSGSKVGQFRSQPQCNAQTIFFHQQSALPSNVSNLKFAKIAIQNLLNNKFSNFDLSCPFVKEVDEHHKKNDA